MDWKWIFGVFGVFIILYFLYKLTKSGTQKTALNISREINVKPKLIEDMIVKLGDERGRLFVNSVNKHNLIKDGVYTFFIYQVLINPQGIKELQDKFSKTNYSTDLDLVKVENAFMFFRDLDVDLEEFDVFLLNYKNNFC
jgi:hypothetical protein